MSTTNIMKFVSGSISAEIAAQKAARDAAEEALRAAKSKAIKEIADNLRQNRGMIILRSDAVAATGLSKEDLDRLWSEYRACITHVTVTRRFAEVDEQGRLIPNGRTRTDSRSMVGYYMS